MRLLHDIEIRIDAVDSRNQRNLNELHKEIFELKGINCFHVLVCLLNAIACFVHSLNNQPILIYLLNFEYHYL